MVRSALLASIPDIGETTHENQLFRLASNCGAKHPGGFQETKKRKDKSQSSGLITSGLAMARPWRQNQLDIGQANCIHMTCLGPRTLTSLLKHLTMPRQLANALLKGIQKLQWQAGAGSLNERTSDK